MKVLMSWLKKLMSLQIFSVIGVQGQVQGQRWQTVNGRQRMVGGEWMEGGLIN